MAILVQTARLLKSILGSFLVNESIEDLVIGLFFTGVKLSNGAGGLCYTPIKEIPDAVCCPSSAGRVFDPKQIRGMKVVEVLEGLTSGQIMKKTVAIAVLNALSTLCWEKVGSVYGMETGRDALEAVRLLEDDSVAVVGAIVPVLRRLKARGGKWWVIEQDPRVLKPDEMNHFVPWKESAEVLNQANVVISTGVTLINDTLETILSHAKKSAEIAVIGPTASMLPDALFEWGVTLVGGVWVREADKVLKVIAAGGSGYHFLDRYAERIVLRKTAAS